MRRMEGHRAQPAVDPVGFESRPQAALRSTLSPTGLAVLSVGALSALIGTVGADFRWAAVLGNAIVARWSIPDGVPFATAPTSDWANAPVLAEVVSGRMATAFGERGLYLLQILAVVFAFTVLAQTMRRAGATDGGRAAVLLLVAVGSVGAVAVARLQLFSVALFAVLIAILNRSREDRDTRRLWWLPVLFALWANLHGGVLVGVGVTAIYLAFERFRRQPAWTVALLGASLAALFLTPALLDTPDYFLGIMRSEAARQGAGLWAPLSTSPLDLAFVVVATMLVALARRGRPHRWEIAAGFTLAALTVHTARSGLWLLMVLAVPAARGFRVEGRLRPVTAWAVATVLIACVVIGVARGPLPVGADAALIHSTIVRAGSGPVLAQDVLGEQVVLGGGRVLISNPLDAFRREDQRLYLAWTSGKPEGDILLRRARVVLVHARSRAARRIAAAPHFREVARDDNAILYATTTTG
jgi:hypothetical protein